MRWVSRQEPVPWEEETREEEGEETPKEEKVSRETVREIVRTELVLDVRPGNVQIKEIVRPEFVQETGTDSLILEQMFCDSEEDKIRQGRDGALRGRENQTLGFRQLESMHQIESDFVPEPAEGLHQTKSEVTQEMTREIVREVPVAKENSRETVPEESPARLAEQVAAALCQGLRRASLAR